MAARKKTSRKTSRKPWRKSEPLTVLLERHLQHLQVRNYSVRTVAMRRSYLGDFLQWCDDRGIDTVEEITATVLGAYQRHLYHYRTKTGKPLRFSSQLTRLVPLRTWFRWLVKQKYLTTNPASELELPKEEQRLPSNVLTAGEADTIMNVCDLGSPLGIRDRSMLETFYSTAMRRGELIQLQVHDVDWERGTVLIRQGKGAKDRHVPIGDRALAWLRKYVEEVRPAWAALTNASTIYLSRRGRPLGPENLSLLIADYIKRAEVGKTGSCHVFRHTAATLMLENGADLRSLQSLLGHSNLSTTQIYTHISMKHLKEVHNKTHPARLKSPEGDGQARGADCSEASETEQGE